MSDFTKHLREIANRLRSLPYMKEAVNLAAKEIEYLSADLLEERERVARMRTEWAEEVGDLLKKIAALEKPVDMILHCPACLEQHIDAPEDWLNCPQMIGVESTNAKQSAHAADDGASKRSAAQPVPMQLWNRSMASRRPVEKPSPNMRLPHDPVRCVDEGMHQVQGVASGSELLSGHENRESSASLQSVPLNGCESMESSQPNSGEGGWAAPEQSATRQESIRSVSRRIPAENRGSRYDMRDLQEAGASETPQRKAVAGSLPQDGQDPRRAVLPLQHDAGVRERRIDGAAGGDQLPEEALVIPAHRSHLCHSCGFVWRPSDRATNGVSEIKTKGKDDMVLIDGPVHELRMARLAKDLENPTKLDWDGDRP